MGPAWTGTPIGCGKQSRNTDKPERPTLSGRQSGPFNASIRLGSRDPMEAHKSYERFEQGHQVAAGEAGHVGPHYGRNAAKVVALMAAFLPVAVFLSNEAVKEGITRETPPPHPPAP